MLEGTKYEKKVNNSSSLSLPLALPPPASHFHTRKSYVQGDPIETMNVSTTPADGCLKVKEAILVANR